MLGTTGRVRKSPRDRTIRGEVMADNAAMIGVFEGVGFEVSRTLRAARWR
jgi:RimJ/RimL family protein N-acetyltransferase